MWLDILGNTICAIGGGLNGWVAGCLLLCKPIIPWRKSNP